jgi:ABC-type amino acid transport substrate-binding protein
MRRLPHLALVLLVLVLAAVPAARADVDLTLDAQSLTRLLSIVAPPTVTVGMAPAASIEVAIQNIQVTGFDPAANGGLGHLLTKMRLVAPAIGLDVEVSPRVSLDIRKRDGLSFCYVTFQKMEVPMPWGKLDAASLLPALPVRADHVFEIETSTGSAGLRSVLTKASMTDADLRLTFVLDKAPLPEERP